MKKDQKKNPHLSKPSYSGDFHSYLCEKRLEEASSKTLRNRAKRQRRST